MTEIHANYKKVYEDNVPFEPLCRGELVKGGFQEKLDDRAIPYIVDYEEFRSGINIKAPTRMKACFYVDESYIDKVLAIIKELEEEWEVQSKLDFSVHEDDPMFADFENVLPQVECPECGEMVDIDYPKCPYCKCRIPQSW